MKNKFLKTCPSFKYAWIAFNIFRKHSSLPILTFGEEVRIGIIPQSHQFLYQQQIEWDAKFSLILTKETPWKLLKPFLLWNIWVAKTQKEMGDEPFHLESILFKAWQVTI